MKIQTISTFARRVCNLAVELGAIPPGNKCEDGDLGALRSFVAVIKNVKKADAATLIAAACRNDAGREER